MTVIGDEAGDATGTEPRTQAVDQPVDLGCVRVAAEADLLRTRRLGGEHIEPCEIEAEARIERIGECGKPLDEQRADFARIADGPRGARRDAPHGAVGAKQHELDAARAFAAALEHGRQAPGQLLGHRKHILLARDRLGEALVGGIRRNRQARRQRLALAAERAVELAQKLRAEACGKRRARQVENIADALEPDARQGGDGFAGQAERGERQEFQQLALAAGINDRQRGKPRRRRSGADRAGNRSTQRKAETRYACRKIVDELRFAAEEMRATADVEEEAAGIDRDERRIALAPVGEMIEQPRIRGHVLRDGGKVWVHGARLRERDAGLETDAFRRSIDGDQEIEIAAPSGDDEGRAGRASGDCLTRRPLEAIGREPFQPQAQDALMHRNAVRHDSTPPSTIREGRAGCA